MICEYKSPYNRVITDHAFQVALRQAGYSEAGISEIGAALSLLVKHGVLGLALPTALPPAPLSAAYFPLQPQDSPAVFGPLGQVGLGECRLYYQPATTASIEATREFNAWALGFREGPLV